MRHGKPSWREPRNCATSLALNSLTGLFQSDDGLVWLSAEITAGRTPGLREYLMRELDVEEVTPDGLISELSEEFLEADQ